MVRSEESKSISPRSNELFNNQWATYQKILNSNYMGHREIYNALHELLVDYFQKPFTILELGCGDASFTTTALLNTFVLSYKGIDLSKLALEIAASNMAKIKCSQVFTEGDFSQLVPELVKNRQDTFDAILISFALHHLSTEEKDYIIGQLLNLLSTDGVFILIDIFRKQEEDREWYIKRYLEEVQKNWFLLTPQEYSMVESHIWSSDFPETQETLYSIAQKHNFNRVECLYCDSLDTTKLLCFYR
ncbi:class I SAM-dependent methyltransferase [Calothrix sp. UHCC 0171]|uniref:class I SAM-dependent methyltransferase n=1 Tax=Calothrix sp. UHCC 0171 TaxID=3110245 RepID=UPI002B207766|nr:class I SAM-dependent methyltransferase [Calothrix sp. UHCC 0171]MEA5573468.1 class I SAM-dependent methyltransferase [Calothrix sp. UHCC 0171]